MLAQRAYLHQQSLVSADDTKFRGTETAYLKSDSPTRTVKLRHPHGSVLPIGLVPTQAAVRTLMVASSGGA